MQSPDKNIDTITKIAQYAEHVLNKEILDADEIDKLNNQLDEFIKNANESKVYFKRLL
jgi:hypothetical protein